MKEQEGHENQDDSHQEALNPWAHAPFVCWPTGQPLHPRSLRYFWWTGSLESGHGEHEIGFYHNHGLRSFVVATAENPHPASCAVLALDPLHKFFFRGLGNSGEEVLQSCNNHVERWKDSHSYAESQPGLPGSYQRRAESHGVHTEMWSRLKRTVRGTVRTGFCFIWIHLSWSITGRCLHKDSTQKLYTHTHTHTHTLPPLPLHDVCVLGVYVVCVRGVCVPVFLNVKSD